MSLRLPGVNFSWPCCGLSVNQSYPLFSQASLTWPLRVGDQRALSEALLYGKQSSWNYKTWGGGGGGGRNILPVKRFCAQPSVILVLMKLLSSYTFLSMTLSLYCSKHMGCAGQEPRYTLETCRQAAVTLPLARSWLSRARSWSVLSDTVVARKKVGHGRMVMS